MDAKNKGYYQENFRLRISDYNTYDHLTPHAVLDLFQDVAGTHANYIGVGFDDMIKRNLIWVLLRTKYVVYKYPPLYSTLTVKTWPKVKGKVDFDREYEIYDEKGEVLIQGVSKWVVINKNARRITMTRDIEYKCEMYDKVNFDGSFDKIEDFEIDDLPCVEQKTSFLDMDHNGHINNANYAKYIINSVELNEDEVIKSFEINHIKEIQKNTIIKNYFKKDGKFILIKGIINDSEVSYIARIELM